MAETKDPHRGLNMLITDRDFNITVEEAIEANIELILNYQIASQGKRAVNPFFNPQGDENANDSSSGRQPLEDSETEGGLPLGTPAGESAAQEPQPYTSGAEA